MSTAMNLMTEHLVCQLESANVRYHRVNAPAQFDTYEEDANNPDANGWYGTISANGGLDAQRMYKIRLSSYKLSILLGHA